MALAGFHSLNLGMFDLARGYAEHGMAAYADLQEMEFDRAERAGYSALLHQRFVGTGYFDKVAQTISQGSCSVTALGGSTEQEQFG